MIEILKTSQCFKPTDRGIAFALTRVIFREDDNIFSAESSERLHGHEIDVDKLETIIPIPAEAYCPPLPPQCTIASNPDHSYIKKPNLMSFSGIQDLTSLVLRELLTCEMIREQPHANVATYYGCQVFDGRIIGLCFQKHSKNLMEKVNPGHLNKSMFILSKDRAAVREQATRYLPGIEQGIRHLHSLNRIHNDITPANIMISENDTPVIIDFDTSSAPGTELHRAKRTYGWFDPNVCVSQESNDFDALAELRVWLAGTSPAEYKFGV